MRPTLLLPFLLLSACAGAPKAAAPQTVPKPSYRVVAPTTDPRIIDQLERDLYQPTLIVDTTDLFDREATGDPMSVKLTTGPLLIVTYPQGGGKSTAFNDNEGQATVEITGRPFTVVVSPKISAATLRMAYNGSVGWTVTGLQYDQNGTWARFTYSGTRANCPDDGSACTATRPVMGAVLVTRLAAQPEYTVIVRAEWHPALNPVIMSRLEAIVDSIRIVHD